MVKCEVATEDAVGRKIIKLFTFKEIIVKIKILSNIANINEHIVDFVDKNEYIYIPNLYIGPVYVNQLGSWK